jgi:DNA-binding winged helix-turn-helix (wHTH) protein
MAEQTQRQQLEIPAQRRLSPSAASLEFGPFTLEVSTRSLYRGDEFVPVTPKALDTLLVLVEEAGRVVTKDELMQKVWPDAFVEDGSIANNISILRKLLNPFFEGDGPIATVARRGYRFTEPVRLRNATELLAPLADSGSGQPIEDARKALVVAEAVTAAGMSSAPDPSHVIVNVTSNATPNVLVAAAAVLVVATVVMTLFLRPVAAVAPPPAGHGEPAHVGLSSDPDALRFYFLGLEALALHDLPQAKELLSQATQEDPGFALAHSALSIALHMGHHDKSKATAQVAFDD